MISFMKLINIYKSFIFYLSKSSLNGFCMNEYLMFGECESVTVAIKLHFEVSLFITCDIANENCVLSYTVWYASKNRT